VIFASNLATRSAEKVVSFTACNREGRGN
jgi:hypothetical protein